MNLLKGANQLLSFLLELLPLPLLVWWGFSLRARLGIRVLAGLGLPLLCVLVWGRWCAPRSATRLPRFPLMLVELLLMGTAPLLLFVMNEPSAAWIILTLLLVNRVFWVVWQQ